MLKIIMLGFVLAAIVLSGTMFVADAEMILSQVPDTIKMISTSIPPPPMEKIPSPAPAGAQQRSGRRSRMLLLSRLDDLSVRDACMRLCRIGGGAGTTWIRATVRDAQ